MTDFEFDLVFALPDGEHDLLDLSDAVLGSGFDDAVCGVGTPGLLAVALETTGEDAESVIVGAARAVLGVLPAGSELREVRPDLVSLADVAKKLNVKRQALQKRKMPKPAVAGYYRVTEIAYAIVGKVVVGGRKPRFDPHVADPWFAAGAGAQIVNARLALGELDPSSLEYNKKEKSREPEALRA